MKDKASPMTECRVLLLPGWLDSDAAHWQSRWERRHGWRRVTQSDWLWPRRGDWMARLEEVLLEDEVPAVLVAHSLGCHLVAPPDLERDDLPPNLHAWRPISRQRLPFAAITVTSGDDPFSAPERSTLLARDWGARQVGIGAAGHINGESGLGDWPAGQALVAELTAAPASR